MRTQKRTLRFKASAIVGASVILMSAGTGAVLAENTASDTTASNQLTEIIVTAEKRSENLQNVPESISVLSETALSAQQLTRVEDMAALVPGMSYQNFGAGQNIITLRGVTSGPTQLSTSVGVYVDDIPFGSSSADNNGGSQTGDFDTFDMTRVEVLQGPQGTLYGANAIGGLIKYVTNPPDPKAFDAIINVGGVEAKDGGSGYSVKGMVNIPISSDAAFRLDAFQRRDPGFIDDNGPYPRSNVNANTFEGGRASILWTPTERLSIRLTEFSQSIDSDGQSVVDLGPTNQQTPITVAPLYGDKDQQRLVSEPFKSHYNLGAASIAYDMDWATLSSTTSYSVFNYETHNDFTNYFPFGSFYGLADNQFAADGLENSRLERTTEELRLTSKSGSALDWQIGGYYDLETAYFDFNVVPYTLVGERAALSPDAFATKNPSTYRDLAVFGDVDYHFTSKFDLQLGARESYNHQSFSATNTSVDAPGVFNTSVGTSADDAFTFLVSPRWNVGDNTMVYARIAKGYRAGGPNALPAGAPADVPENFKPDSLVSYEVGTKKEWPELAHLTVNAAVYHIIWTNIQMETTVDGLGAAVNASKATINGAQFTARVEPLQGLSVALDVGYQDAKLAADAPIIGGVTGDRLPTVPLFNGAFTVDYRWAITTTLNASAGATYRYTGNEVSDFALNGDQYLNPSIHMLDLRAGVEFGRSSLNLVAKNITNEVGYSTIAPGPVAIYGYRMPPQTIGIYFQQGF